MELYVNVALGLLLIGTHHWARSMFYQLPLHQESGFFVSNDTILNRRFNPRKSWHARFSGGGKLVPEFFYSFIYLCVGGRKYAFYSRLAYTVLSILLFPPIAIICSELGMGQFEIWLAMFFFALVLAEPQFGSYLESGEQFELFALLWGMALVMMGIDGRAPFLTATGIGIWLFSAFFINLSLIVTPFVFSIQLMRAGEPWLSIVVPWIIGASLYVSWLMFLKTDDVHPFTSMARAKLMGGQKLLSRQGMILLYAKFQEMLDIFGQNLPILLLAAFGFFSASSLSADPSSAMDPGYHYVFILMMCVLISFFLQASPAPYHSLPIVPLLVIWATYGAFVLRNGPLNFWTALSWIALAFYYLVFFLRPKLMNTVDLYRWVWKTHPMNLSDSEILKNAVLPGEIARIKTKTFDFSVFLAGPHTQLQILLQAAYPTSLVAASAQLDGLEPNWQMELMDSFRVYPAPYILDTADCFSIAQAARWGFEYQMLDENPGLWRLYGHQPDKTQWKGQEGRPNVFDFNQHAPQQG